MNIKLKIILLTIVLSVFAYATESCYEFIPRIKVLNEQNYSYSSALTKQIFKNENKTICVNQKELNTYYQNILKYFTEVKGYYIPPIVKVKYPKENSIAYGDFLVNFQKVNDIIFTGKGKSTFFKYLTYLSLNNEFKTSKILQDQQFFNSLNYLKLDGFDIKKTKNGKFNAIYNINQDTNWQATMSLSNSKSKVYNSNGDLSSFFSFDLFNPIGMAWHYNLSASSSKLHSKSSSYSDYFSASLTVPYKSFRLSAQLSSNNNVVRSSNVEFNEVSNSFYQGKTTSQSYNVAYSTTLNEKFSLGMKANMKFDQYNNYSFVNTRLQVGDIAKDSSDYATFSGGIDGSFSHPNIYISGEIKYIQLLEGLSNLKVEQVYYDIGRYYKNDYNFVNYNLSVYVPFSTWGNYSMYLSGQYTNEVLRDVHKFGAGDRNSVRGFGNNYYISSDSGYFIRNDININVNNWLNPYVAYDYANLKPTVKNMFGIDEAKFSGVAIGTKGKLYSINYDLFVGKPTNDEVIDNKNDYTVAYSLSYKF